MVGCRSSMLSTFTVTKDMVNHLLEVQADVVTLWIIPTKKFTRQNCSLDALMVSYLQVYHGKSAQNHFGTPLFSHLD